MVRTWGQLPAYGGRDRPPTQPQPGRDWQSLQVVKQSRGGRLIAVQTRVVSGDPEQVTTVLEAHTASVEHTHLTSRRITGRLVRKTLSFSKQLALLQAASSWEDAVYHLTRPVKTLRVELGADYDREHWLPRTPAMAAGLTDHISHNFFRSES